MADKHGYIGTARPLTFWTDFNQRQEPFRNPSIVKYAFRDLYFTLDGFEEEGGIPKDTLHKQQEISGLDGKLKIKFIDFDFPASERAKMLSQQSFHVKATVVAATEEHPAGDTLVLGVTRSLATQEVKEDDIQVPNTAYHIQLAQLMPDMQNPANSRVVIRYFDDNNLPAPPTEVVTVEAFVKPFINLVWGGIITLVIGFGFSVVRRRKEALVAIDRAERSYARLSGTDGPQMAPDAAAIQSARSKVLTKKKYSTGA
jgi:hypothetical protein